MTELPPLPPPPADQHDRHGPTPASRTAVDGSAAHAEAAALGAVLVGGDADQARQTLPPADDPHGWTLEGHAVLWQAICDVTDRGDRPDMVAVTQRLMAAGRIDVVGGPIAVADLAAAAPPPSQTASWCATVTDRWHRRRMAVAARRVIDACADLDVDPATAIVDLDALLDDAPTSGNMRIWRGDQLDQLPEPEWLVDRRITRGFIVVWGQPKAGKSFVALDLAAARAVGDRWHGMTVRPGRTLYCAAEGLHDAKSRLQAAFDHRDAPADRRARVALSDDPLDLTSSRDLARLDRAIADHGADLLVLDTWARVAGVTDENDNAQASAVVAALDRLRHRHSCDIVAVHHARKDGLALRGASALLAALDTAVKVTKDRSDLTVDASDIRGGPEWPAPVRWQLTPHGQAAVLTLTDTRQRPPVDDDAIDQILGDLARGTLLPEAVVSSKHGRDVLRALKQHAQVRLDTDPQGRPVLRARQTSPL